MKNTQEIACRIKESAKNKNMTVKQLLEKCDLNINTVSDLAKGKQISYLNFAKMAECLNVSVDYLLGRTDEPTASTNTIKTGDINSSSNIGNNNSISLSATAEAENEISSILSNLTPRARTELMMMIYQFADKHTA